MGTDKDTVKNIPGSIKGHGQKLNSKTNALQ